MREVFLRYYLKVFKLVARDRVKARDLPTAAIHTLLVSVLSTSVLMWSYASVSYFHNSSRIPFYVGMVACSVHLLSPLILRITNNMKVICSIMLGAGVIHQGVYTYFTGGFTSNNMMWFGVIPLLAGVIVGKRFAVIWASIVSLCTLFFLVAKISGFAFPNSISETGNLIAQSLICFGYIFLSTASICIYLLLDEQRNKIISDKNEKVQNLLRVVLHDISNPLMIIKGQLYKLNKRVEVGPEMEKILIKSNSAVFTINEIVDNVRNMYAVEEGKREIQFESISLRECLNESLLLFENKLKKKNIKVNCVYENIEEPVIYADMSIFKNQVLANIISNAIKFSQANGEIDIRIFENPHDCQKMNISIRDYGVGMPEELIENLFSPNKKTSRRGTGGEKGTGYGMIILKSFVESFDGDISVNSREKLSEKDRNSGTEVLMSFHKGPIELELSA